MKKLIDVSTVISKGLIFHEWLSHCNLWRTDKSPVCQPEALHCKVMKGTRWSKVERLSCRHSMMTESKNMLGSQRLIRPHRRSPFPPRLMQSEDNRSLNRLWEQAQVIQMMLLSGCQLEKEQLWGWGKQSSSPHWQKLNFLLHPLSTISLPFSPAFTCLKNRKQRKFRESNKREI